MNMTLNNAVGISIFIDNKSLIDVLEFGVFDGTTIKQIREAFIEDTPIYGFDTFVGLPEDWTGTELKKGNFNIGGKLPDVPNVRFFKGLFKDTIPIYLQIAKPIKLIHVDCDLYSSTKDVLYPLNSLICSGTIICFDEWYYNAKDIPENRQHEQKCFYEWVKDNNREFIIFNKNILNTKI